MTLYDEGSNASSTHKASDLHRTLEVEKLPILKQERHAHRWSSIARGAMLARPARRANYHRALRSGKLIRQNELRRSEGSGMLIGDPLSEGSNASSTNSELWRAENSFWEGTQTLRSGAQGTSRGLTNSNKGTKLRAYPYPMGFFRKKAEHSMC